MSQHDPLQIYPSSYLPQPLTQSGVAERLATVEAHLLALRQASLDSGTRMSGIDTRITSVIQEQNGRLTELGERIHRERESRQSDIEHVRSGMRQIADIMDDKMRLAITTLKEKVEAEKSEREATIRKVLVWIALAMASAILPAVFKLVIM